MNTHLKFLLPFLFLFAITGIAQHNTDSLFNIAKQKAHTGERIEARALCRELLALKNNNDIRTFIGKTYAWQGEYDSARVELGKVLNSSRGYYDAIEALIDLEFWDSKYEQSILDCDTSLIYHPNEKLFLLKKVRALIELKKFVEAESILKQLLVKIPDDKDVLGYLDEIKFLGKVNKISLNYAYDYFENNQIAPWQFWALQYNRKTSLGTIIARINTAQRFNTNGLQFETEAYPKLFSKGYLYINMGYSSSSIFPKYRSGLEYYRSLPHSIEASAGLRWLYFQPSQVYIYTAYVGQYIGNYLLGVRTYITPGGIGTSVSGSVFARRYFSNPQTYLGIKVAFGRSPDDRKTLLNSDQAVHVIAGSCKMEANINFRKVWTVNVGGVYELQEYYPSLFRNVYTLDVTLSLVF